MCLSRRAGLESSLRFATWFKWNSDTWHWLKWITLRHLTQTLFTPTCSRCDLWTALQAPWQRFYEEGAFPDVYTNVLGAPLSSLRAVSAETVKFETPHVKIPPMPNSFPPKLIFYLHIKGKERRIQNHNPSLSLFFQDQALGAQDKRQRASQSAASSKRRPPPFMLISHALKIAEGGMHIKHYNQAIFEFQCQANEKVLEWDLGTFFIL